MQYKARVYTLLKRQPVQGEDLPDDQKVVVPANTVYTVDEILETNGLHSHVEIAFKTGSWWIFLPHWDTDLQSQEVKAVFSLKQARVSNLVYGSLVFSRGTQEVLRVRATSGQPGYQYPGSHTQRGRGCIPPDNDWKISSNGYRLTTPGIEGMFYHITPDPDPDTGRSEFGLHRDPNVVNYPGSAGCIVVKTSDFNDKIRPFLDGLRRKQSFVSLSVVYST